MVGYFVWCRSQNGVPTPMKHDKEIRDNATMPETVKRQQEETIKAVAMTVAEWSMSLEYLMAKYPLNGDENG